MKHADRLIERILMLDGLPNLQDLGKLLVGENVPEILECDLQLERGAQAAIKDGIAHCEDGARLRVTRTPRATSSRTRKSTSTTSKPSSTCWPRSGCRTTCNRRWAKAKPARELDGTVRPREMAAAG